jgi:hypothetical protein
LARRSKKKKRNQSRTSPASRFNSNDSATSLPEATEVSQAPDRQSSTVTIRLLYRLAVLIVALWWLFLGGMALFTANPVTLNREQIIRAEIVVTATVVDPVNGTIHVEKSWKFDRQFDSIMLENLKETGAKADVSYIIPVTESRNGRYNVTTTRLPNNPPLIYPSTKKSEEQLQSILENE